MAGHDLTLDPAFRRSAARVLEEFDFTGLRDRFDEITQPTLLLWGGNDPVVPYSVADSVARLIPCSELATFQTAFHRPHAEMPDTVLAVMRRFLKEGLGARC
jgi:pimeloyl-ACP methyl ester carboxylesterase